MNVADALKLPLPDLRQWLKAASEGDLVQAAGLVSPYDGQTLRLLEAELTRRIEARR